MDLVYTTQLSREYIACRGRMEHLSQTALEKCDGDWNLDLGFAADERMAVPGGGG
jgi:hypothetical protein